MACTGAGAPGPARPSGSSARSSPASRPAASTGAARRATIAPMCASANGRRRIRVWIWIDRSPSMAFVSELAQASKVERATVLGLAARRSAGARRRARRPDRPHAPDRDARRHRALRRSARARRTPFRRKRAIAAADSARGALESGADRRFPQRGERGSRRDRHTVGAGRARPGADDRRSDRGDVPLRRPCRISSARTARRACARRARKACARPISRGSPRHREAVRAACAARGWGFALHRTDRPAAQALLALRMRLEGPDSAGSPLPSSRAAPDVRPSARLRRARRSRRARRLLVALYIFLRVTPPRPREICFRRFACCSASIPRSRRRTTRPGRCCCCGIAIAAAIILAMAGPIWNALPLAGGRAGAAARRC